MHYRLSFLLLILCSLYGSVLAQAPFAEGTVVYKIRIESSEHKVVTGTYTIICKGSMIKKDVRMSNGFADILILNCSNNTIYSLQNSGNRKYAVELSMSDLQKRQEKFMGFSIADEANSASSIAGVVVYKGTVKYKNGSTAEIYYSKEWSPAQPIIFDRFPDAKFFPLKFSYTDEDGTVMEFEAEKMQGGTVESAIFRIPLDYKMISYAEYKELSK